MSSPRLALAVILMLTLGGALSLALPQGPSADQTLKEVSKARASGATFQEDSKFLYLNNSLLELSFNKSAKGGLESVLDPFNGVEFRTDKDRPPVLFQLNLVSLGYVQELEVDNGQATDFSYTGSNDTGQGLSELRMNFSFLSLKINVSATVQVKSGDPRSYWGIKVHNANLSWALVEVNYPVLSGLPKDLGSNGLPDYLALPKFDGIVYTDPYKWTQAPYNIQFRTQYPSTLSMQFMALYDPQSSGLFMGTLDPDGKVKELYMEDAGPAGNVVAGISHMFPYAMGSDATVTYSSALGLFHGDWYTAADMYKGWALQQSWTDRGVFSNRTDVPSWWKAPSPIVSIERTDSYGTDRVPLEQWSDVVTTFKALTGTNITLKVLGWENNGTLTGPYYLPTKDGDANTKTEDKEVLVAGGHVMFSTSEGLWRLQVPSLSYDGTAQFNKAGKPWAVLDLSGLPVKDERASYEGDPAAVMDPTTKYWQDTQSSISGGLASDIVDAQELQDLPYEGWQPCYNASHGHPQGYSDAITVGQQTILTKDLSTGRAVNPDFMLTTGGPSELFLDKAQAYSSQEDAPELGPYLDDLNQFGAETQVAPMFDYVYHQYTSSYGTTVPLGGLDIPAHYNTSAKSLAQSFVQGQLPSVEASGTGTGSQKLSSLLAREAQALATYGKDYMYMGQMLQPPKVVSPDAEIPYRVDPRDGYEGAGWATYRASEVLSSAWRSADGTKVAVALVNWANSSADISLTFPSNGPAGQNYTLVMDRNGVRSILVPSTKLPHAMGLTLGPRDVVVIEALYGPDLIVEGIDADSATPYLGDSVNLTVQVANRGSVPSSNVHVLMLQNGTVFDDAFIGTLAPDTNVSLPFVWSSEGKTTGTYNLTAKVWPQSGELSTANNQMSVSVDVLALPKGAVRCTVLDNATKKQLPGSEVDLFYLLNHMTRSSEITGSNLDAIFQGVPPGTYGIDAVHDGYYPGELLDVVVVADRTTSETVQLDPIPVPPTTGDLQGTVSDNTTHLPLGGATVTLNNDNMNSTTGLNGTYDFTGLSAGLHAVTVTKDGYQALSLIANISARKVTVLDVHLIAIPVPPPAGNIVGTVQDKVTFRPLTDAQVNLTGDNIDPLEMTSNLTGGFLFPGLPLGNYSLNVTLTGYYGTDIAVEVSQEGDNSVSVLLEKVTPPVPQVTLRGHVLDKKGKPLVGAQVSLVGVTPDTVTYSNSTGAYVFVGRPLGSYVIKVSVPGYQDSVQSVNATAEGTVVLDFTMTAKATSQTSAGTSAQYILMALLLLMLLGLAVMLLTGRKKEPRARKHQMVRKTLKRKVPKAAVPEEE